MSANDIEVILSRQLADCLTVPVFLVDPDGTLLFYNEPAEEILGKRFEHTGVMKVELWSTMFEPIDEEGNTLPPEGLPLVITLTHQIPAFKSFWIRSLDGKKHKISVTSYPIIGRSKRFSGAVALFWTEDEN